MPWTRLSVPYPRGLRCRLEVECSITCKEPVAINTLAGKVVRPLTLEIMRGEFCPLMVVEHLTGVKRDSHREHGGL